VNLFSLHGKHFRDDENRLTANLAVMLNEARRGFLPAFLALIGVTVNHESVEKLKITLQEGHTQEDERSILDAKLKLDGIFVAVIESKVGFNPITVPQALKYARWLVTSGESQRVLVFVTQIHEPLAEAQVLKALSITELNSVRCVFLLWQQIFSLLQSSEGLSPQRAKRCDQRIRRGMMVSSVERLSYLFLKEVEKMAYDLSVVDDLVVGDVEDVVIQVQDYRFMKVALEHNTWFPPGGAVHGLKPAKYVAYYQMMGCEMPKRLSHIARVRKVWNRVSFEDARALPEFRSLFSNAELAAWVATFKNAEGLFHIATTDPPVALAHPIPLGSPRKAKFLAKKRFPLTRLLSAETSDDLFLSKEDQEENTDD